jgi:hypothetical protein
MQNRARSSSTQQSRSRFKLRHFNPKHIWFLTLGGMLLLKQRKISKENGAISTINLI